MGIARDQFGGIMAKQEAYRDNAARCLEMADKSFDVSIRLGLIDMAHVWLRLAEQAEKNDHLDAMHHARPSDGAAASTADSV